jgi:phospholipid transport system substrate-binding protein
MKSWMMSLAAAAMLLAAPASHAGTPEDAQKFIDGVASDVLNVLKTDTGKSEKMATMETIFANAVDIPQVAKYVLGKHWREATPEQQKAYVDAYQPFVIRNYAGKLTKYSGQNYKLKNARASGSDYVVTMEIIDPGNPSVFVDYRLRENSKGYKIIDIAVEGVSLSATQRSEFNSIVSSKGIDYLISALEKQANKNS